MGHEKIPCIRYRLAPPVRPSGLYCSHMRTLLIIVGLLWGTAWADTVVRCRLLKPTPGSNHAKEIRSIDLISYVNHFSLSNLLSMRVERDRDELVFSRDASTTTANTTVLRFQTPVRNGKLHQAWIVVDRSPRQVIESRYFKASIFISDARAQKVLELNDPANNGLKVAPIDCAF